MKRRGLIVIGTVAVAAVAIALLLIFVRTNPATRALRSQPDTQITVETAAGEIISLDVKSAVDGEARASAFKGVDSDVVQKHVLYIEYPFPATIAHRTEGLRIAIDMMFFDATGALTGLFTAKPDDAAGYRPEDPYQYVLMAREGYFAEMGIGPNSRLRLTIS